MWKSRAKNDCSTGLITSCKSTLHAGLVVIQPENNNKFVRLTGVAANQFEGIILQAGEDQVCNYSCAQPSFLPPPQTVMLVKALIVIR
jgi:hypothetical protein